MNEATTKPTVDDVIDSLTGYEEVKIEELFGHQISDLLAERQSMGLRALVYAIEARKDPKTGHTLAMSLKLAELSDYFTDDEPEVLPEEPVTEQGKDDSLSD